MRGGVAELVMHQRHFVIDVLEKTNEVKGLVRIFYVSQSFVNQRERLKRKSSRIVAAAKKT